MCSFVDYFVVRFRFFFFRIFVWLSDGFAGMGRAYAEGVVVEVFGMFVLGGFWMFFLTWGGQTLGRGPCGIPRCV